MLLDEIIGNNGLIGEIEKPCLENEITLKRFKFYNNLGFKKIDSEYLLYDILYTPIININSGSLSKKKIDKIFFDYYKINCGEELKDNFKIIK